MAEEPQTLTFEASLERLEHLVESMEGGDIPLDVLLNRYEEGQHLLRRCNTQLQEAELRIEQLRQTAPEVKTSPLAFENEATED
jgi:exodeoxyribonuclease VII small subunit